MNTPNLTPETIDQLSSVRDVASYNWNVRRLAGYRDQLSQNLKMVEIVNALIDEGDYSITLSSLLIPGKSLTINCGHIEGDVAGVVADGLGRRSPFLIDQVLTHLLDMQSPKGEHADDVNCADVAARLEVLRLVLTPAEYAAITAPAPMNEPEPTKVRSMPQEASRKAA